MIKFRPQPFYLICPAKILHLGSPFQDLALRVQRKPGRAQMKPAPWQGISAKKQKHDDDDDAGDDDDDDAAAAGWWVVGGGGGGGTKLLSHCTTWRSMDIYMTQVTQSGNQYNHRCGSMIFLYRKGLAASHVWSLCHWHVISQSK